ncbi:hypothetical protein Tco_1064101, partial [Tanacetum coccineum]
FFRSGFQGGDDDTDGSRRSYGLYLSCYVSCMVYSIISEGLISNRILYGVQMGSSWEYYCTWFAVMDAWFSNHMSIIVLATKAILKLLESCGSILARSFSSEVEMEWIKFEDKCDIKKPIWYLDSGCSRHMTGVKSYPHKYVEQPGLKVFDEKKGNIFNFNKEVVMIAPRVRDVYVLDMTSLAQESCFFARASKSLKSYALSWKPCQRDSLNLPDHSLIPAESNSLPHAHAQTTKTYFYQGRLLASFQEDAKYEHVGQDTRSQRMGKDDKDKQGKDLKISD